MTMSTSSSTTRLQAERDDIAREYASAPQAQRDLLALLSEQTPPPAEDDTPPMPAGLLERLRGHYGVEMEEPVEESVFTAPRRAVAAPGLMERLRKLFSVPAFQWGGLAAACLAIIAGMWLMQDSLPGGSGTGTSGQWRGQPMPVAQTGPLYVWIGSAGDAARPAVADKVPDMLDAATVAAAQELSVKNPEATVYAISPADGSVAVLMNGATKATLPMRAGTPPEGTADGLLEALRKAQRQSP